MQRENYILKSNKRGGFAMIMAIIVLLMVSTVMVFSLLLVTKTAKQTTDIYLYEQVTLYSKSAAELALLKIAQEGCVKTYNTTFDNIYDVNITMKYIFTQTISGCENYIEIVTPEQNGSVLMDIALSVREDASISTEPIRYFRRTLQKL